VKQIAIVGAGVSGLTCAVVFAEHGYRTAIFADEIGQRTTSAAAGAIWYPYDAEPAEAVIKWSLATYKILVDLSDKPGTGVSLIELRTCCRAGEIQMPDWAASLGGRYLQSSVDSIGNASPARTEESFTAGSEIPRPFASGFTLRVPLTDTTIYLDYLANRFIARGGVVNGNVRLERLEDVDPEFDLVLNCAGIGAKDLVPDAGLEPHRGQVAIVSKLKLPYAVVCDDPPLTYAIPRMNDCVFGGTNDVSDSRDADPATTARIVAECSRILNIDCPKVLAERVGLRPFRKSGVCLRVDRLRDDRPVIHNYGHGGSGFTLSWGCADEAFNLLAEMSSTERR
jgi:D-amino-acid oxidase